MKVVLFYIVGFLSFFWFAWGVYEYLIAGGAKEGLAAARKRMTWAIIGFVLFIASFAVSQYAQTLFDPSTKVTNIRNRDFKGCPANQYWDVSGECKDLRPLKPGEAGPPSGTTPSKPVEVGGGSKPN